LLVVDPLDESRRVALHVLVQRLRAQIGHEEEDAQEAEGGPRGVGVRVRVRVAQEAEGGPRGVGLGLGLGLGLRRRLKGAPGAWVRVRVRVRVAQEAEGGPRDVRVGTRGEPRQ
jgi:hypothetical protein